MNYVISNFISLKYQRLDHFIAKIEFVTKSQFFLVTFFFRKKSMQLNFILKKVFLLTLNTVDIVITHIKGTVCVICSDPQMALSV